MREPTHADVSRALRAGRWVAVSHGCAHYADDCGGAALEALAKASRTCPEGTPLAEHLGPGAKRAALKHLGQLTGWRRGRGCRIVLAEVEPIAAGDPEAALDDRRTIRREEERMRSEGRQMSESMAKLARVEELELACADIMDQLSAKRAELDAAEADLRADPRLRARFSGAVAPKTKGHRPKGGSVTACSKIQAWLSEHVGEVVASAKVGEALGIHSNTVSSYFSSWSKAGRWVSTIEDRPGRWLVLGAPVSP